MVRLRNTKRIPAISCLGEVGILFCCCILPGVTASCDKKAETSSGTLVLSIEISEYPSTRALTPDEDLIKDLNIYVIDSDGVLEDAIYYETKDIKLSSTGCTASLKMVGTNSKDIYVCANLGFRYLPKSKDELLSYRYHLSRPDEISRGIPMSGIVKGVSPSTGNAGVKLTRLASKLSIIIDRRGLDEDVALQIRSIKLCNCPRNISLWEQGGARKKDDLFSEGQSVSGYEVDLANSGGLHGISTPINIYMLENFHGKELNKDLSPYIEIKSDYDSVEDYTLPDDRLTYRFYIRDQDGLYGNQRNTHYTVTVTPQGKGLNGDSWRVDKSELSPHGPAYFNVHPATYIECRLGDKLHVWCDVYPPRTPFDIGIENLEFDKERGMFDYEIDPDGHGVTLSMKKKGTSMLYPEAGYPVNDEALIVIVCEP